MPFQDILLIDDDPEDQEIFTKALARVSKELRCTTCSSAKEALNFLIAEQLSPDVIFLDLNMPIMSGQEFLAKIKDNVDFAEIPVIVLSTSSNPMTIKRTRELGAIDFITKPDRFDKLVEILKPIINCK